MKFTGERMIPSINKEEDIYFEHIARYIFAAQFVQNKIALDIACGSGYGSEILLSRGKAMKVLGIDISEEAIKYCNDKYKNENITFSKGNVNSIPIEDNSIDVIISFETLEHVREEDQKKFLEESKRVIREKGIFIISTPNVLESGGQNLFHAKELNRGEFNDLLLTHFKYVKYYYQDNIEANYILSSEEMGDDSKDDLQKITERMGELKPSESMYLLAVCSDERIPNLPGTNILFSKKPRQEYLKYNQQISVLKKDLGDQIICLKKEIKDKNNELNRIYNSRIWRFRNYIRKITRSDKK